MQDPGSRLVVAPAVVFGIISPGTSRGDRILKVGEHQAAAAILRHALIESTRVELTVHGCRQAGELWQTRTLKSISNVLEIPGIGIDISAAGLHDDLTFTEEGAATA